MSCQRPLSVLNKSLYYRFGLDKARNIVNCGQCESCLNSIKNDYLVRSYFHRMECVGIDFNGKRFKKQGFVLFPTLTYKKKLRPKFHYTLADIFNSSSLDLRANSIGTSCSKYLAIGLIRK